MPDNELKNSFVDNFSKITSRLKFSMMLYEQDTGKMYSIDKGEVSGLDIPESIKPLLKDSKMYCTYFSDGENIMVLYFIRIQVADSIYVIVLQDNKKHSRINRFVSELIYRILAMDDVCVQHAQADYESVPQPQEASSSVEGLEHDPLAVGAMPVEPGYHGDIVLGDGHSIEPGDMQEQARIKELEEKLKNLSEELSKKFTDESREILEENKQLKAKIEELENKLPSAVNTATGELAPGKSEDISAAYMQRIKELEEKIASFNSEGKSSTADAAAGLRQELSIKNAELSEKDKLIKEQDAIISEQRLELDHVKTPDTSVDIHELVKKLEQTVATHQNERKLWDEERERLLRNAQNISLGASKTTGRNNMTEINSDELAVLKDTAIRLPLVQAHLDNAKLELTDKNSLIEFMNKEIEELKAGKSKPQASKKALPGSVEELSERVSTLEDHSIKLQVKLNEKEQEIKNYQDSNPQALKKLQSELDDNRHKLEQLELDLESAVAERDIQQREVLKLDMELKDLKAVIASKETSLKESEENNKKSIDMIKSYEVQLEDARTKLADAQTKHATLDVEIEDLKNRLVLKDKELDESLNDNHQEHLSALEDKDGVINSKNEEILRLEGEAQIKDYVIKRFNDIVSNLNLSVLSINNDNVITPVTIDPPLYITAEGSIEGRLADNIIDKSGECSECLAAAARSKKTAVSTTVNSGSGDDETHYNVTFFPILDAEENVIEVVEVVEDITAFTRLHRAVDKYKEELQSSKKARATGVNEISALHATNLDLEAQKEKLIEKNNKMLKVIEKLVSKDAAKELLNARAELKDYQSKLTHALEAVKNYKVILDEQKEKYSDLNRRAVVQMERLVNIISKKAQITDVELRNMLEFINRELESVKKGISGGKTAGKK